MTPSRRTILATLALAGCGGAVHAARAKVPPTTGTTTPSPPTAASTSPSATPSATPSVEPPTSTSAPGGPAVEIVNGSRSKSQVALTFHGNGDPALAEALLQAAEAKGAHITVFAVGNWLAVNPALGRRILAGGHGLANHTYTHPDLSVLSETGVEDEFAKARDVLVQVSGNNGRYARPSQMNRSTPLVRAAAGAAGYATVVAFDVDPSDYLDPGASLVISRTLAAVQRGSIVSMHLGHAGTVQALPSILDGLATRGLTPVTVQTLLT
ncbi:MAG TPA: polysaccharide deacetylase family protein [Frankiaceae bacterium]|jgi:peptidoglycan/xylan/chitin deacetylase (PgdA/CDA1 family)|nr:polysaccharide deacetylase family protein [Frankiaceae bacterium]